MRSCKNNPVYIIYSATQATIVLLPAWPCNLDVSFKLAAPGTTVVELVYNGAARKVVSLTVTPHSRSDKVVFAGCVDATQARR